MYNFNFIVDEKLVEIFDDIWVKQGKNEKNTTIALTNKRLLFLDCIDLNDGMEALRITRGIHLVRSKEVYYQINLDDIDKIDKYDYYKVTLKNKVNFEFDNDKLYRLLLDYNVGV